MNRDPRDTDRLFEDTLNDLRDVTPDEARMNDALARVRAKIEHGATGSVALETCEDHRALFAAYDEKSLDEGRRWLVSEHLRECSGCSAAHAERLRSVSPSASNLEVARPRAVADPMPDAGGWRKLAAAAALILPFAGGAWATQGWYPMGFGGSADVPLATGAIFRVADEATQPAGEEGIRPGERLRTARGAGAEIALPDGSVVEVGERSEVSWHRGWRNTTLRVHHGRVIVKAAPQGFGNLYVATDDCRVAVKGTVFSVTSAVKGSRVSVLEGEVHVHRGPQTSVLLAGQQMTTDDAMPAVPLDVEIGWSRNVDEHLAVMKELVALGRELERVKRPELRYETRLAELLPASTAVYVAIPNFSDQLSDSYEIVRDKIATNDVLRRWWDEHLAATGAEEELQFAMERVRELGDLLGEEVLLTFKPPRLGEEPQLLVLAEVADEDGLVSFIETAVTEEDGSGHHPEFEVARGPVPRFAAGDTPDHSLRAWIHDGVIALAPNASSITELAAARADADGGGFTDSPLWPKLDECYRDGAGWLIAADVHALMSGATKDSPDDQEFLERLGILDATLVVAERKRLADRTVNRATLYFDGPREGIAAWIAEPGPMGALDFVSADAHFAAGFIVAEPSTLIRDMVARLDGEDAEVTRALDEFRENTGLDLVEDVAVPLGGELVFALDGPLLPVPSWKLIVEVNDDVRLQRSMEALVREVNAELAVSGSEPLALEPVSAAGRAAFVLRRGDSGPSVAYTFAGGYMIAAPRAPMLDLAMRTRESGYTLTDSPRFRELLPPDGPDDYSAVLWQNVGSLLGPLAGQIGAIAGSMSPEQKALFDELAREARASLTVAHGGPDRIAIVNAGAGPLGGDLGTLVGLGGFAGFEQTLASALHGSLESVDPATAP